MYSHKVDRYCSLFLGNFVAHAGTVRKKAGEPFVSTLLAMVVALLIPSSGVLRGLLGIWRHAKFCISPLIAASKTGALCTVVRTAEWKYQDGIVIQGSTKASSRGIGAYYL